MLDCEAVSWPGQAPAYWRTDEEHDVPEHVGEKWISIGLAESCDAQTVAVSDNDNAVRTLRPRRRPAQETEE